MLARCLLAGSLRLPEVPSHPLRLKSHSRQLTSVTRATMSGQTSKTAALPQEQLDTLKKHAVQASHRADLRAAIVGRIPPDARFVLIGEASHGTKDFYDMRADITKHLIVERGFKAVVAEADFPDMFRVNSFVRHLSTKDKTAKEALGDFTRFPRWMWRNGSFETFIKWLCMYNKWVLGATAEPAHGDALCAKTVGVYGMDVYSLHASMEAVLSYLRERDPEAAQWVDRRYKCFDRFGADSQFYGLAVASGLTKETCEACAKQVLDYVHKRVVEWEMQVESGQLGAEGVLAVEANAMAVAGAEEYYRKMFTGEDDTWNIRDTHFLNTVKLIEKSLKHRPGGDPKPKMVLWAHNSHLGDARYTDMGWRRREINVGQKMRENYPGEVFNIGFSTHHGTVTAASDWDAPHRAMRVNPSRPDTYERAFHDTEMRDFAVFSEDAEVARVLAGPKLQRAIGVVYRPDTERQSHYFEAKLPHQFDCMIHLDRTHAVLPLDPTEQWIKPTDHPADLPETFPIGL